MDRNYSGAKLRAGCSNFFGVKRYIKEKGRRKSVEWANTLAALNGEINVDYSQRGAQSKRDPIIWAENRFHFRSHLQGDFWSLSSVCREVLRRISGFVDSSRIGMGPLPNMHTCIYISFIICTTSLPRYVRNDNENREGRMMIKRPNEGGKGGGWILEMSLLPQCGRSEPRMKRWNTTVGVVSSRLFLFFSSSPVKTLIGEKWRATPLLLLIDRWNNWSTRSIKFFCFFWKKKKKKIVTNKETRSINRMATKWFSLGRKYWGW